jgi:hypothetical protein
MNASNNSTPHVDIDAHEVFGTPNLTGTPERNLLMATLERAILDYVGNQEAEANAAEEWIFADEGAESYTNDLFTFGWVCEHLDLEPAKIADVIRNMPKRGNRRVAPWYFKEDEARMCA